MDISEPDINRNARKPRGKPFQKGISGNPKGKRKGTRNAATVAAESLLDGQSEALIRKAIEMALAGDTAMMRLVIDRILPPRRERPLRFELPSLQTLADAMTAISRITEGVTQGELTENEARTLVGLVHTFLEGLAKIQDDLRLTALEEFIPKIETAMAARFAGDENIQPFKKLSR